MPFLMVGIIRKIIVILFIALLASFVPWSASARDVTVSGSSTVMPLAEAAAEEFNVQQKDYVVTVSAGGTGAGILGIAERKNDIAMASREVTEDEKQRFGDSFEEFLVGLDGISLAVSDEVYLAGVTGLSRQQVKDIYSGNITNWKEVGGPDADIYVISREDGSGTRDNFNEAVLGSRDAETPGVDTVAFGGAEVKTAISGSDKAIGYLGFNYLGSGVAGIAFNGVAPSYDNIKLDLYELHRHLYFNTFGKPTNGAQAFIDFVQGPQGQKIAKEEGFIPI
ncbi:MAG: phosphate ABC transporter substrate-binding protein [Methanothrix sp.]|nr:phosphate ABC transporter substrate-binding protein [Methanothrix sp.]